jgi:hypothetical protein
MAAARLGLWDYVKGAFNARVRVKGLGQVPVNWLALAGVGVASIALPALLPIGLGLELAFLTAASHSPRFRKVMDGQVLLGEREAWDAKRRELSGRLSAESAKRLAALERRCALLTGQGGGPAAVAAAPIDAVRQGSVDRLTWIYLRLLQSREAIQRQTGGDVKRRVELELKAKTLELEGLATGGGEPVRKSLESTVAILKRRLDNLNAAADKLRYIESELERIEQQVELLIEESAFAEGTDHLSDRIDTVTATLEDANSWMAANAELLGTVATELEAPPAAATVKQ